MRFILLFLTLLSCVEQQRNITHEQDPEFAYEIRLAEEYLDINYEKTIVFNYDMEETTLGTCYQGTKTIHINYTKWGTLSDKQRQMLILHEIIHCHYDVRHNHADYDYNYEGGIMCPPSIMTPNMWSPEQIELCLDNNEEKYYNELNDFVGGI